MGRQATALLIVSRCLQNMQKSLAMGTEYQMDPKAYIYIHVQLFFSLKPRHAHAQKWGVGGSGKKKSEGKKTITKSFLKRHYTEG